MILCRTIVILSRLVVNLTLSKDDRASSTVPRAVVALLFLSVAAQSCAVPPPQERTTTRASLSALYKRENLGNAFVQIASGNPVPAEATFRRALNRGADPHYPLYNDALRGAFLANLYAKDDRSAATTLSMATVHAGSGAVGSHFAVHGQWQRAWAGYLRDAKAAGSRCTDATVETGLERAVAGDLPAARSAWLGEWVDIGDCNVPIDPFLFGNGGDTKNALIGISYLQESRWTQAEAELLSAVLFYRATSGYTSLFPGNIMAMQMLFAYRERFKRGPGRYAWPQITFPRE